MAVTVTVPISDAPLKLKGGVEKSVEVELIDGEGEMLALGVAVIVLVSVLKIVVPLSEIAVVMVVKLGDDEDCGSGETVTVVKLGPDELAEEVRVETEVVGVGL